MSSMYGAQSAQFSGIAGIVDYLGNLTQRIEEIEVKVFLDERQKLWVIPRCPGLDSKPPKSGKGWKFEAGGKLTITPSEVDYEELRIQLFDFYLLNDQENAPWYESQAARAEAETQGQFFPKMPLPLGATLRAPVRILGKDGNRNRAIDIPTFMVDASEQLSVLGIENAMKQKALIGGLFESEVDVTTPEGQEIAIQRAVMIFLEKLFGASLFVARSATRTALNAVKPDALRIAVTHILSSEDFTSVPEVVKTQLVSAIKSGSSTGSLYDTLMGALDSFKGRPLTAFRLGQLKTILNLQLYQRLLPTQFEAFNSYLRCHMKCDWVFVPNTTDVRNGDFGWMETLRFNMLLNQAEFVRVTNGVCLLGSAVGGGSASAAMLTLLQDFLGNFQVFSSHASLTSGGLAYLLSQLDPSQHPRGLAVQLQEADRRVTAKGLAVAGVQLGAGGRVVGTAGSAGGMAVFSSMQQLTLAQHAQEASGSKAPLQATDEVAGAQRFMDDHLGAARASDLEAWSERQGFPLGYRLVMSQIVSSGVRWLPCIDNSGSMAWAYNANREVVGSELTRWKVSEGETKSFLEYCAILGLSDVELSFLTGILGPSAATGWKSQTGYGVAQEIYDFSRGQGSSFADYNQLSQQRAGMAQGIADRIFKQAPNYGTPIGEALDAQLNRCIEFDKKHSGQSPREHVIVLFTDGDNQQGRNPAEILESMQWKSATNVSLVVVACAECPEADRAVAWAKRFENTYRVRVVQSFVRAQAEFKRAQGEAFYYSKGCHLAAIFTPPTWADPKHPNHAAFTVLFQGKEVGRVFTREELEAIGGVRVDEFDYQETYLRRHPHANARAKLAELEGGVTTAAAVYPGSTPFMAIAGSGLGDSYYGAAPPAYTAAAGPFGAAAMRAPGAASSTTTKDPAYNPFG